MKKNHALPDNKNNRNLEYGLIKHNSKFSNINNELSYNFYKLYDKYDYMTFQ